MAAESKFSLPILRELLEDTDLHHYIAYGASPTIYDPIASAVFDCLSPDLSVKQIAKLLWRAFYEDLALSFVGGTNTPFIVSKQQAIYLLGPFEHFTSIAKKIREQLAY